MTTEGRIKNVLVECLEIDPCLITPQSDLVTDLLADELDEIYIIMSLEEEFNIDIPDDKVYDFDTVGDIIKYITGRIK